jgi:hypothetical protein
MASATHFQPLMIGRVMFLSLRDGEVNGDGMLGMVNSFLDW